MKEKENRQVLIAIGVFVLYFLYNRFTYLPIRLLNIDYNALSLIVKVIYLLIYEFVFLSILYLIYHKRFKKDFNLFKKNFKPIIKKYIEYWALAFGLMIIANITIVSFLPNSVANNQEAINNIFIQAPLYMIISAVLFAPFIEETVFRLSFRKMFKNNWLFIIMSGLVFGSMHVVGSFTKWVDLIYIIPYSIPGFVFAYTLVKSKNIFVPMSLHLFHNGFMMLLQTILLFLK